MPTLTRPTANVIAGLLALALVGVLVIRTSSAVFTAETNNDDNSVAAGTIVLTDDNTLGSSLFTMTNVAPGEFAENCIVVNYSGSLDPEAVKVHSVDPGDLTDAFYVTNPAPTPPGDTATAMEDQVRITIEEGTGGSFDDCTGFAAVGAPIVDDEVLGTWAAGATDYVSGDGVWDPAAAPPVRTRTYRVTLQLDITTDNTFQGASLTDVILYWSTRSTATPGQVAPN